MVAAKGSDLQPRLLRLVAAMQGVAQAFDDHALTIDKVRAAWPQQPVPTPGTGAEPAPRFWPTSKPGLLQIRVVRAAACVGAEGAGVEFAMVAPVSFAEVPWLLRSRPKADRSGRYRFL